MNKISVIILREFTTRILKKSFIILTILMPFMMASIQDAKKKNIQFNSEEVKLISEILIANLSPEEQQKARKILQMMKIC